MSTTAFDDQHMSEAEALRLQCHSHDHRREAAQQTANSLAARVEQLEEENGVLSREEERLEGLIIRAADFLEVPPAFDNRVQDFEFWLDSPPTGDDLIGKLQAKIEQGRSLTSTYTRIEKLEEEIRTVAAHAADLEHKIRRIKDRAVNGMCHGLLADDECRNILAIIEDGDEAELEQVMRVPSVAIDGANLAIEDVSEGGDPD